MKPYLFAAAALYCLGLFTVIAYHASKSKPLEKASRWLLVLGLLAHTGGLVQRVLSTGHAPMASMYETLVFYSWTTVLVTAIVIFRYAERTVESVTVPVALVALFFALVNAEPGGPLNIFLRTRWFEVHVTFSFAAYALFTLAFAGALLYLLSGKGEDDPEKRKFQEIAGRSVLWGFFFFSAAMFSGAVWA